MPSLTGAQALTRLSPASLSQILTSRDVTDVLSVGASWIQSMSAGIIRDLSMPVKVRKGFNLRRMKFSNRATMQRVGEEMADHVRARTQGGRDAAGHSFVRYSPRGPKAGQSVDLTESGDMLANLDPVRVSERSVTIGFSDPKQDAKARAHNYGRGVPRRRFMGVGRDALTRIIAIVRKGVRLK